MLQITGQVKIQMISSVNEKKVNDVMLIRYPPHSKEKLNAATRTKITCAGSYMANLAVSFFFILHKQFL